MDYLILDRFYPNARALRAVFDKKFANPLQAHRERFVWDFWHVPGEYTHLRTPAFHYFPKREYEAFHRFLVRFGRERLGCHDISPPWLSCYVEGCRQAVHRDTPHGPLAYVFSLSRRGFRGGETFIKNPNVQIEPKFNRLTLFNPDLSHGVREVKGTLDPRHGRLVIHGWFVQPRVFWTGPLKADDVAETIDRDLNVLPRRLGRGLLSVRLEVQPNGRVSKENILVNTLMGAHASAVASLMTQLADLRFPQKRSRSCLTLPLILGY